MSVRRRYPRDVLAERGELRKLSGTRGLTANTRGRVRISSIMHCRFTFAQVESNGVQDFIPIDHRNGESAEAAVKKAFPKAEVA